MPCISFPSLSIAESQSSHALTQLIAQEIAENGAIPFSRFMELAMYAPKFGYYTGGTHKIGTDGDFITAPMLTPLFGQTLARQIASILPQTAGNIYEFGAGTGNLAAVLLNELSNDSGSLKNYYIIELSSDLKDRQHQFITEYAPDFLDKVVWLNTLPENFDGVIIGNEVLDAMPIERISRHTNGDFSRVFVDWENEKFILKNNKLDDGNLFQAACNYFPHADQLSEDYTSELHLTQFAFIQTLAEKLIRGAMIWIDYGFDSKQFYHPERIDGTLIGHYHHHTIHDPFFRVGLTDLTAHINFSDIAEAGYSAGLDLIGYATQANFLFNLGILDLLAEKYARTDTPEYVQAAHAIQQLTAPHEMGELFKVIAFGKNVGVDWLGFAMSDLCHKL